MPIVIKEIQVRTVVEREMEKPSIPEKTVQQLKRAILKEIRISEEFRRAVKRKER